MSVDTARLREVTARFMHSQGMYMSAGEVIDAADEIDLLRSEIEARKEVDRRTLVIVGEAWEERDRLKTIIAQAVSELDAEHGPEGNPGKEPWGCRICFPGDGDWPCVSKMIADDLRAAITDS